MAISVDWGSRVINVPRSYLTPLGGGIYELDVDSFRRALKGLEASTEGMAELDTHIHVAPVTFGATTLARVVTVINGYTITFEDGSYRVRTTGANHNIADVTNVNGVSIETANSAGLVQVSTPATYTTDEIAEAVMGYDGT